MRLLAILIMLFLITSCATTGDNQLAKNWQGKNAASLVSQRGNPNQKIVTEQSTTYIYTSMTRNPISTTTTYPMVVGPAGKTIGVALPSSNPQYLVTTCTTTFVVDKHNVIVSASSQGACNPSGQQF